MTLLQKDRLIIKKYPTREQMGEAAARDASEAIKKLLAEKHRIRVIFAAAPSQNEFLVHLAADNSIDFSKIIAFHMDEYIGLRADAPQGFSNFLKERIFSKRDFGEVNYLNGLAPDSAAECRRYAALLNRGPIDIVFMGIGENAHIAFNDPAVADFNDPNMVKTVDLDEVCRMQQVNDGCFHALSEVPLRALTLTIPALLGAGRIFCMVPSKTKAQAVYNSLAGEVTEKYPASILRTHQRAVLYVDSDSGVHLEKISGIEKV
jgi:glucosamine-6-phosphate deaminase